MYTPARTQSGFTPTDPILFSVNNTPGISVSQAIAGECDGLAGRDDPTSSFEKSKITCRIEVGTATSEQLFN